MQQWEIWHNARITTMTEGSVPYGLIEDGAIAILGGHIAWVGPRSELPINLADQEERSHDCGGRLLTPGLIDCHTHLVYGGNRAGEFEQRLTGVSYADISRQGGGIMATVRATRAASEQALVDSALQRLDALLAEGVTTVEIKSGYGLEREAELKMLWVARQLAERRPVTVRTTFLGAHALPPDYEGRSHDYISQVCEDMLPAAAEQGLADAVDAFCETIAFTPAQVERVFQTAQRLNLAVKLHAEQLSNQGGAGLAARYGALSADHLEYLDEAGVRAMAAAGTVAVLLPGAFYFLRETQLPPIEQLREQGVPIALATDLNPGSSPINSILAILNMACTLFHLTPEEALTGVTRHAAQALGLAAECGTLEVGKAANFVLWDAEQPAELTYRIGFNPCAAVIYQGELVRGAVAASED